MKKQITTAQFKALIKEEAMKLQKRTLLENEKKSLLKELKGIGMLNEAIELGGKKVDVRSLKVDDIDVRDYPDFSDAYISYGRYEDGTELSEEDLETLSSSGLANELIFDQQLYLNF